MRFNGSVTFSFILDQKMWGNGEVGGCVCVCVCECGGGGGGGRKKGGTTRDNRFSVDHGAVEWSNRFNGDASRCRTVVIVHLCAASCANVNIVNVSVI